MCIVALRKIPGVCHVIHSQSVSSQWLQPWVKLHNDFSLYCFIKCSDYGYQLEGYSSSGKTSRNYALQNHFLRVIFLLL